MVPQKCRAGSPGFDSDRKHILGATMGQPVAGALLLAQFLCKSVGSIKFKIIFLVHKYQHFNFLVFFFCMQNEMMEVFQIKL